MSDRGFIKQEDLEALRERVSIVDVAAEHMQVRRAGRRFVARCPFHDEKTASFSLEPTKNLFHCFGCQEGGDVFTLVQKLEGLDFAEAAERLASRFGVTLRYEELSPKRREEIAKRRKMTEAMAAAASFFHETLKRSPEAETARQYLLDQRGFSKEVLEMFEVGFSPVKRTALQSHLKERGFSTQTLIDVNLAIQTEDSGIVDRFRGRVMFPIRDKQGEVIGFGARKLDDADPGPKYLNTSETPLYRKSEVLYGLDRAAKAIVRDDTAVIVEGYTDVIALQAAGIEGAIASCGTAVGAEHLKSLRRFASQLTVCLDSDEAGIAAAERMFVQLGGEAEKLGLVMRAVVMPNGSDPADTISAEGPDEFRSRLGRAIPLVELVLEQEARRYGKGDSQTKTRVLQAGLKHLSRIQDAVVVRAAARSFADRIGVDPAVLFVELDRVRSGAGLGPGGAETILKRSSAQVKRERTLLQLAAQMPSMLEPHLDLLSEEHFATDEARALWRALRGGVDPATEEDPVLKRGLLAAHVGELQGRWDEEAVAELVAAHMEHAVSRRIELLKVQLEQASDDEQRHAMLQDLLKLETERRRIRESRT